MGLRKGRSKRKGKGEAGADPESAVGGALDRELDANVSSGGGNISSFAREVIGALDKEGVPPLPPHYQAFFYKLVESRSPELKKQVAEVLDDEIFEDNDKRAEMEKQITECFNYVKTILESVAVLYKNLNSMNALSSKRSEELANSKNAATMKNTALAFVKDINKLMQILGKQTSNIKGLYNNVAHVIREVENQTIYDKRYDLYNKRYMVAILQKEKAAIQQLKHRSSMIVLRLASSIANKIDTKQFNMISSTVSKLLIKTSRRSDILGHLGSGYFCILAKHLDINGAVTMTQKTVDLVANTHFFLGSDEVTLNIKCGITEVSENAEESVEEIIENVFAAQKKADADKKQTYVVHEVESPQSSE